MMADPASGRCWLFYCPSLTSLLVLLRPVDKPNFNILDPQGPSRVKYLACRHTLASEQSAIEALKNCASALNARRAIHFEVSVPHCIATPS